MRRADQGYQPARAGGDGSASPQTHAGEWMPPREDLNSPDLYIPGKPSCMHKLQRLIWDWLVVTVLITYILLSTLHSGLSARFNPTIFGTTLSRALGVVIMDFLFVKGSCYFLGVQQSAGGATADIVAYGGYKFVG